MLFINILTLIVYRFKAQRKQIENSLREKAETNGGG